MKNISRIMWGILLVVLGVFMGLNASGITDINLFFEGWWTLFIIIPSIMGLFNYKENFVGNLIGLAIGVILLLSVRGIIEFDIFIRLLIPGIFVIIGLSLVFNEFFRASISKIVREKVTNDSEVVSATFAEQKIRKDEEEFKSANLDAVFGSIVLDLTNAKILKDASIKSSAIFGGITIIVPENTNVKVKSTPIFGGVSNKVAYSKNNKDTIYIDAFCMFGGVEIKWPDYKKE